MSISLLFLQAKNLASTCFAYVCLNSFHPRQSLKIEPMKVHNAVRDEKWKIVRCHWASRCLSYTPPALEQSKKIERFMLHHNAKCHMAWYQDGLPSCHQYHWQWVQNWINQMASWILQKAGMKECWKLKSPIPNLNTQRQIFFWFSLSHRELVHGNKISFFANSFMNPAKFA